jgi:NTE family protein
LDNTGTPPKIGLALGSGASRGWSHIGIVKALLDAGIEPDVVCGTSVGAMVGAAYLTGNMQKLEDWVLGTTRADVLRFFDVKLTQSGFVDTKRFRWFLHTYVTGEEQCIEDLSKKFAAVSTILGTGRETWFTDGPLADAVSASMAMPGLFPAVRIDGRWMVDGGLVNPVPVSVCHALGAEVVIAVNLNSGIIGKQAIDKGKPPAATGSSVVGAFKQQAKEYSNAIFPNRDRGEMSPGLFYAIAKSINIFQDRITRSRLAGDPADVVLSPKVAQIGMLEFHRAGEAIEEGERCVNDALAEMRRVTGKPAADITETGRPAGGSTV